jgi:hypothetical protein
MNFIRCTIVDGDGAVHQALRRAPAHERPVFRVVDGFTREVSLRPVKAGAVIFNLKANATPS